MSTQILFKKLSGTGLFILYACLLQAAVLPYTTRIKTVSPSNPVTIGLSAATAAVQVTAPWTGSFIDAAVSDRITLGVDHENMTFITLAGEIKVRIKLEQWTVNNTSSTPSATTFPELTIDYQPFGNTTPYIDKSVLTFNSAYKFRITIDAITQNGTSITTLPANIFIDADIIIERYVDFSVNALIPVSVNPISPNDTIDLNCDGIYDELVMSWAPMAGAEEYHLEWTFVNDYGITTGPPYVSPTSLKYDFKNNSTRIATTRTNYNLTLTFEHGYLLYRVRAIGRELANPKKDIVGIWSAADTGTVAVVTRRYHNKQEHEAGKNWQYSATYAEEAKKKEVISYFDGGLRNRESVTKVNSDKNTIVGQTIYDHQGRPAINVLPVPVNIPTCTNETPLKYYPNFNRNDSAAIEAYSRLDFDLDAATGTCNAITGAMGTVSGASNYYSPANPKKTGAQAFVPDGEFYPFTQIEYTPDNTGRIRRQGGVGPKYQLGKNHETKYFYGSPNQIQLDRLFGSEVGDAGHYKKNVVIDANGQVSVSYLDQEGRTIATALAGNAPKGEDNVTTILAPLDSESNAKKQLTIDLFAKNALGVSAVNVKNIPANAIIFNSQLLVAYESEYDFYYHVKIDRLTDPCLKTNICFNCVYDLEIKVTDDCGNLVNPMPGPGNQPVYKRIGHFKAGVNGKVDSFYLDCTGTNPFIHNDSFKLNLPVGNYTISKILTVNSAARDFYVATYLDSTYNSCVKTLDDFQKEAFAKIDTSSCNITCATCDSTLRTIDGVYYKNAADARDAYVAAGIGTELEFDYLREACGAPCKTITWCETTYQQLLMDVSPDGQYAQFQNTIGGKVPDLTLSVLNTGNSLPKSIGTQSAHWQNPLINVKGTNYSQYLDEDGKRSIIHLSPNGTNYIPAVASTAPADVKLDAVGNFYYTYPQNLANVQDFVDNWKSNWAKSLVQYHPEYCYYTECAKYSLVQTGNPLSSDGFDSLLLITRTYQEAVLANLIYPSYSTVPTASPATSMARFFSPGSPVKDPFLFNYTTPLLYNVNNYQSFSSGVYSMVEAAAIAARCGTFYGPTVPAVPACTSFGQMTGPDPTKVLDQEWTLLKNFYLSEKRKVQQKLLDKYAKIVCNGYNGCIGDTTYNPFVSGMIFSPSFSSFINSQYFNPKQPCSIFFNALYLRKKKRFVGPEDIHAPSSDEMDYQMYLQSGQCPLAYDFQYLIASLAAQKQLDNTTGEDLKTYGEFTVDLYNAVSGGTAPSVFIPYVWKANAASGNILNGSFVNTLTNAPACDFVLDKTGTGIVNWDDIVSISQLKYTATAGANYEFTATAAIMGSNNGFIYKTIHGSICVKITGCTFPPKCDGNDLAKDLSALMSALQVNGILNSVIAVILDNSPVQYQLFLTPAIKNALGTTNNSLRWKYNTGANQYELYDAGTPAKMLVIKFTGFTPNTYNNSNLGSTIFNFKDIKSKYQNFFEVKGVDINNTVKVTIDGSVELVNGAVHTGLSMGNCGLPEPIACQGVEYQLREDLEALLYDVLLKRPFNSNMDLTKSIYYTQLIQSYFPDSLTKISSIATYQESKTTYTDSLIFTIHSNKGDCKMLLHHKAKLPPHHFKHLVGFDGPLTPYGPTAADNNYYKFFLIGNYSIGTKSFKDTIWGVSCLPLQFCDPCSDGTKPKCDSCTALNIIPPDTLCKSNRAVFRFETKGCINSPDVLWNFGDGTISSLATHTYSDTGAYTVTLSILRKPGCQGLISLVASVTVVVKNCGKGKIPERDRPTVNQPKTSRLLMPAPIECEHLYGQYLKMIKDYNASAYAIAHNHTLLPLYPTYESFVDAGLCNCAENYIQYLEPYLVTLALPVDIDHFIQCDTPPAPPKDPCKDAYQIYMTAVSNYNEYVLSHAKLKLPPIKIIYKEIDFTATGFCYCVEAYVAFLQALMNGTVGINIKPDVLVLQLDIAKYCERLKPPCDPTLPQDTFLSPAYVPYTNPCVQYQIDLAYLNAANAYHQYLDSLTTWIATKYNQHCMKAFETFAAKYDDKEYHFTLYYYDQAGNLVKTIPPEGVVLIDMPDTLDLDYLHINADRTFNRHTYFTNHTMATAYTYNSLNQLVRQSMPDHDLMDIWDYSLPNGLDTRLKVTATQFVNSTKGYLSGYVEVGAGTPAYRRGYVYTTDNGGVNWTKINDIVASDLKKVQMIDALNGFAVGNHGMLLKTIDGGTTWDLQQQLYYQGATAFNDLYFINPLTGIIIGNKGVNKVTVDGGINFLSAGLPQDPNYNYISITYDGTNFYANRNNAAKTTGEIFKGVVGTGFNIIWTATSSTRSTDLVKIQMVSATDGYAIGIDGTLLQTNNNGTTWTTIATGISDNFKDVYFKNITHGVAIIDSIPGYGLIYKTTNGGNTWSLLSAHNGTYYNRFQFYQSDKGYAVGNKNTIKRLVLTGNFGLVNIPAPGTSAFNINAAYFSDGDKGWIVGNSATIYYTTNGTSTNPAWTAVATGLTGVNADFKEIFFGIIGSVTENTGLLLGTDGQVYKMMSTPANGTNYLFTKITNAADNIIDLDDSNGPGGKVYGYDKTAGQLTSIDKTAIATSTALNTVANASSIPAAGNVKSIFAKNANTVFVAGLNGDLYRGDNVNSGTVNWTEQSKAIISLPIHDIQAAGANTIYAVGPEGSLLQSTNGNDWKALPTATVSSFNTIKFNTANNAGAAGTMGLIAGDNGQLYKNTVVGSVAALSTITVNSNSNLYDIALNANNQAYICGASGTVLFIPDITIGSPVASIAGLQPALNFRGIGFKFGSTEIYTVGDHAAVYYYRKTNTGISGAKIKAVFTPGLNDVNFVNSLNGYTIGEKDIIRHTTDGGLTWSYVKPIMTTGGIGSIPQLNGVWTTQPDKAIIIGNSGYVGNIAGTGGIIVTASSLGTSNLFDVAFRGNAGYITGQAGLAYKSVNAGSTFTTMLTAPTSTGLRAIHIFSDSDNTFIAVGNQNKILYYNGTSWISHDPPVFPGAVTMKFTDVFFHDDRTGYVVGTGGAGVGSVVLRCDLEANIQTYVSNTGIGLIPSIWKLKLLTGINGVADARTVDVVTIDFPTRYHGFLGGSFNTGTPTINYARLINDETEMFSTRFWYDRLGRMVISQNTKQYNRKKTSLPVDLADYSYTLYDKLGRISEVGELSDNANAATNFSTIFGEYVNQKFNPDVINDTKLNVWINACSRREVTKTYYDETKITGLPITQDNLRKRVATVTYEDVDDNNPQTYQHATHYSYDIHGNVKTVLQDNPSLEVIK